VRKNAFMHTPGLGVVWDSKHNVCTPSRHAYHTVLPTKTSLQCIHCTGISPSFLRAGSQVSSTHFINLSVLVIFRVVSCLLEEVLPLSLPPFPSGSPYSVLVPRFFLLMVSLSLITQYHLILISPSDSGFSCIVHSHLRTHQVC